MNKLRTGYCARRVMIIGQGGREHAIARQLSLSGDVDKVLVVPGSDGMLGSPKVEWRPLKIARENYGAILELAKKEAIDLVIVGPEQPLADGLTDFFRSQDISVFGPSREGARLESSKIHAKELLLRAGVATARSIVVSSVKETLLAADSFQPPYVLKADGLAAGKGVFIEKTKENLKQAAEFLFEQKALGEAGARALLEEFSHGIELSHLVLTNGIQHEVMPAARDHKRLKDGDEGPNTGGMGVIAPVPLAPELFNKIEEEIVKPVIEEIQKREILYRGVLYFGLMLTEKGPTVLEFNTRFGDPEAQVLMPLLDEESGPSWGEIMTAIAAGEMPRPQWHRSQSVACIVLAAEGYPDSPVRGTPIEGLEKVPNGQSDAWVIHAGTNKNPDGVFVTAGGRVLNVIGASKEGMDSAIRIAYQAADKIKWPGMQCRLDIGKTVSRRNDRAR